ncbi:TMP-TENI-domain-containing protein [Mycena indigotica]|uniref:TMP-TENI-domain-containing protein n=1 Tax=Mycena indigotica TaxID=2126181 RepID=A0A8H6WG32_9AGAR|nr:TMP-TENI-domain-containing protein [Mycena indigotica]KAF7315406.1 TMP-TENI-domain-containing protein [Mycena indigotica]
MSTTTEPAPSVRVVPGAPPPKEVSNKTARKKRKAKTKADDDVLESSTAALIETAPSATDIQDGAVATELVAEPTTAEELVVKPSPIVDLIYKRLKATSKKIGRISTYAATDLDKLNDDQKATLKTLPALEAVQKELTEVKKAVETHEAQLAVEVARTRQQTEKIEAERVATAVAEAEDAVLGKVSNLLNFLRLRPLLASGEIPFGLENAEVSAVFAASEILLGEASEAKDALVSGLLFEKGSYDEIPFTRLLEITQLCLNPLAASQESTTETVEQSIDSESIAAQPLGLSTTGSFDFMQASELEPPFEENAEWVERPDAEQQAVPEPVNGHADSSNAAIDWADDEGGLPPIAGLHAKFGTSGSATPVVADDDLQTNGHTDSVGTEPAPPVAASTEDDGFTTARGRGRARGGFRADSEVEIVVSVEETAAVAVIVDVVIGEVMVNVAAGAGVGVATEEVTIALRVFFKVTCGFSLIMNLNYSLYLVTDRRLLPPHKTYLESLEQALQGGVTVVQLREKDADTAEFLRIAQETKALTDKYNIPLIINDRIDIAAAVNAYGVHLGQTDMPIAIARRLLPSGTIIGISCNSVEEVRQARESGADYVGLGAVWDTQTKKLTKSPIGVRGLGLMLRELDGSAIKAVAIGGIKSTNLARLLHGSSSDTNHRLDGVAVVSDIVSSSNPLLAARNLKDIFNASLTLNPLFSSNDDILDRALRISAAVRNTRPLVHQMTNIVVSHQSASMTLALGASPIMATAPEEMADLCKISNALLVNIGTLMTSTLEGMLKGGVFANASKIPVVLDPVGVGASAFRRDSVNKLLDLWQPAVIKGNAGELAALAGSQEAAGRGVDSVGGFADPSEFVRRLAKKEHCVIVLTGKTDYISDGDRVVAIQNGDPLLGSITGSGCMLGSCIAAFCAATNLGDDDNAARLTRNGDFLAAAVGAVLTLTVASELAAKKEQVHGIGTFLPALIDEVSVLSPDVVRRLAKVVQIQ